MRFVNLDILIEEKRNELVTVVNSTGDFTNCAVLSLSKELDDLIASSLNITVERGM